MIIKQRFIYIFIGLIVFTLLLVFAIVKLTSIYSTDHLGNSLSPQQQQGLDFANITSDELAIIHAPNIVQKKYAEYGSHCTLGNCPDIRGVAPTRLENAHLVMTRLLRLLDLVCRELNIEYCCSWGTLLGAVRHQGFIPWDMDVDVLMTPEDVAILEAKGQDILKRHGVFLQTPKTDPVWATKTTKVIIAKLRDNLSCYSGADFHDGFQVDIFKLSKSGNKMTFDGHSVPFDNMYPLRTLQFEGFDVSVPNKPEAILAAIYGSDLSYPPILKRVPHEPIGTYARPCSGM
jgi:hypothetical protein